MMVKNEEELLPQCLESIKDVVDEIIVVDTGSEDRTVEIAELYGAQVYHHPWENNFSKHRNQSIDYATGDWFLIIDADEELNLESINSNHIKKTLSGVSSTVHAVFATVIDLNRSGLETARYKSARLFRNKVGVHYEGAVHNQVCYDGEFKNSDLQVFHYGYDLDEEKMEQKFRRTTALLKKRIERNSEDYDAYFYLANSYGMKKDLDKAIEYARKSLDLLPDDLENRSLYQSSYFTLASCYLRKSDYPKSIRWALEGLEQNEMDVNLLYILTVLGLKTDQPKMTKKYGNQYIKMWDVINKDPAVLGAQFVFHGDDKSLLEVKYRLLTTAVLLADEAQFRQIWHSIKSRVIDNPKWIDEIFHNLGVSGQHGLLLEKFTEVTTANPDWRVPVKYFFEPLKTGKITPTQMNRVLDGCREREKYIDSIFRYLYESGAKQKAYDLLRMFPQKEINDIGLSFSVLRAYQKDHMSEKALTLAGRILRQNSNDTEILNNLLQFYHEVHNSVKIQELLASILNSVQSYLELPDSTLLILSIHLIKNDMVLDFISVCEALQSKNSIQFKNEIKNLSDFGQFFAQLGEKFKASGQSQEVAYAFLVAFLVSGTFRYLEQLGNYFSSRQNPMQSIQYYQWLQDEGFLGADQSTQLKISMVEATSNPVL